MVECLDCCFDANLGAGSMTMEYLWNFSTNISYIGKMSL